jgi:hypothetical protein
LPLINEAVDAVAQSDPEVRPSGWVRLAVQLPGPGGHPVAASPGRNKQGAGSPGANAPVPTVIIPQWVQLSDGRWIS